MHGDEQRYSYNSNFAITIPRAILLITSFRILYRELLIFRIFLHMTYILLIVII